ncbi:MAG: 50S ribosomal protein L11 methyltransferase [Candidatus Omnitrophica bacterium]|nr:50S ribosomal protein L11 methyltransferase [Candidatus Omnitrophota bacterium]
MKDRHSPLFRVRVSVRSKARGSVELIRAELYNLGIAAQDLVEEIRQGHTSFCFFPASACRAREFKKRFRSTKLKEVSLSVSCLRDADWKTRWKKYFKPFDITPELRLVPLSNKGKEGACGKRRIYIDTVSAFGSGLHATTRMMARLIGAQKGKFRSFLDIGTGSGILSVIAHCYGAREIWALDSDREVIPTARNNFRLNNFRANCLKAIDFLDFRPGRRFDLVCANLNTEDLVRFKKRLIAAVADNGCLAVSGISRENYPSFRARFKDKRLSCRRVLRHNNWFAVLFRKQ